VYDETHATQEETPDSVDQFIKQRTRWNQGFYQVFFKGDWARMPSMKQKITALYILLNSLFQALIVLYLPLGLYIMLTQSLPVPIALISWIPIFMLITQLIVNLIGLGEFTRAYGERMPFLFRFKTALVYYPYQLLLSLSAARAIWRLVTNRSSWEKTAHSNLHRQSSAPVAQGTV
jgi:cellulose synthase/poly-beta-1,6-N-acetylglucosamine synthase-like glycosyltransferase